MTHIYVSAELPSFFHLLSLSFRHIYIDTTHRRLFPSPTGGSGDEGVRLAIPHILSAVLPARRLSFLHLVARWLHNGSSDRTGDSDGKLLIVPEAT